MEIAERAGCMSLFLTGIPASLIQLGPGWVPASGGFLGPEKVRILF
jgi:hypothetical protein